MFARATFVLIFGLSLISLGKFENVPTRNLANSMDKLEEINSRLGRVETENQRVKAENQANKEEIQAIKEENKELRAKLNTNEVLFHIIYCNFIIIN